MIFYPIQTLVDAGVRDLLIVTGGNNAAISCDCSATAARSICRTLTIPTRKAKGHRRRLAAGEHFAAGEKLVVMLGDNVIEKDIRRGVAAFRKQKRGARVYLKEVPTRVPTASLIYAGSHRPHRRKPKQPKSNYAVIGIYMYDPTCLTLSVR